MSESKTYIFGENNIVLENNVGYDVCYIGNMILTDFYGSSINDEEHMAKCVKDFIDDEDQAGRFHL